MFGVNHDSDHSISEDEDLGLSFSLCDSEDNKEGKIQVLSHLEILRKDASTLDTTTNGNISSGKRPMGLCVEDEIELPVFNNENDTVHFQCFETVLDSDEEMIVHRQGLSICPSDDEIIVEEEKLTFGSTKVDRRRNTWSEVNKEVEALACLNDNPGSYLPVGSFSKLNKSLKGGQGKGKPNMLFRFRSRGMALPAGITRSNEISMPLNDSLQTNELHTSGNRDVLNSNMDSHQVINIRNSETQDQNLLSLEEPYNDCNKRSVTELLVSLQEKSGLTLGNSAMHYRLKGKKTKAAVSKSTFPLGDKKMYGMVDVRSSSEDEDNFSNPKSILKPRTIADQFHEAFEAMPQNDLVPDLIFHRESSCMLFESLQQVIMIEKEREMDYLKIYGRHGNSTDGRGFMDVRILSKSLEAKLNVCCCTLAGDVEIANWIGERILTIIFCSRVCNNVEFEVENLIRIYPPWKEVNMEGKDEMIILSTYFSQI